MILELAVLKNFDAGTYKAAVQLAGSLTTYFDDVPVSRAIPTSALVVGNRVILAIPGDNPKDACVIATWPQGSAGGAEVHGNEFHNPDFAEVSHSHSQLHDRSHALDSTPDHAIGNLSSGSLVKSDGSKLVNSLAESAIATLTGTQTLTNKRTQPKVSSAASGDISPDMTADIIIRTAQAAAITINNPSGSPAQGEKLIIRLKDNGTARAISFGSQYRKIEYALPTTTVAGKTVYMGFIFNNDDTKWDMVAINQEA